MGAQIAVPMVPVSTTLQTLALCVVVLGFGPVAGGGAALLYLAGVVAGLPILSSGQQHGGLAFVQFVAAGYVVGFGPAAVVGGALARRWRGFRGLAGAALVTHGMVFAFGVPVLAWWVGLERALDAGFLRFVLGAVVKSGVAAALVWGARKRGWIPARTP